MDYESSDILGSSSLPVRDPGSPKWSGFSKTAFFLALILAVYVGGVRAWNALLKWREKAYRLSMRRRHGIPDHDHRPFNVAYAAVLRARREEDVANNRVHRVDVDELYAQADRQVAPVESNLRQRNNQYRNPEPINGLPGRFNPLVAESSRFPASSGLPPSSSQNINFADRYNPNPPPATAAPVVRFADEIEDADLPRRSSIHNLNASPRKHQKRALEEYEVQSDVPENPKKTRVEGDEFIDGDEDALWVRQQRGEKRVMRDEDLDEEEASPPDTRVRGKRARKVSLEHQDVSMGSDDNADDMDVDDEDQAPTNRGKKRDAGSTFEGEEDESDNDQAQKTKRKRRTRKSDAATAKLPSRGQKRDRDGDEEGSDVEAPAAGTSTPVSRKTKKRGKKNKEGLEDDEGVEGSAAKGKGRAIGDEWESNGVHYKIGPNGQRLRQALVKKAARRFIMPVDSQHPDKNANLEVCIETWLTEEEHNDFKSRHLLAWQDSPKGTQEPESLPSTPAVPEPPSTPTPNPAAKGKNLLWDSPASPFPVFAPSPAEKEQRRPRFRQSIAADLGGARVNPFEKANALHVGAEVARNGIRGNARRVVAARETGAGAGLPGLADSTNNGGAQTPLARRTFSKWEKQDLEAKAMMKMREATQAKVKERELREQLEKQKAAAAALPAITLSKPSAEPAKPPAILLTAPTPTPSAGPPATQPSGFSFAPSAAPAKPSEPPAAANKPAPPNFFAPPASTTPATSAPVVAAGSGAIPNPFAKPAAAAPPTLAPPASTPASGTTTSNPTFSFAPMQAKVSNPAPAPAPAPTFSFAQPAQKENPPPEKSGNAAPAGGSLLSRMGAPAKPAESSSSAAPPPLFSFKPTGAQAAAQPPKPVSSNPTGDPAAKSAFGMPPPAPKPAETASEKPPTFSFKPTTADPQANRNKTHRRPVATTAPNFSFGFGGGGAKPAAPAAAATTPSSLTGALGPSDPKPAASATPGAPLFSFKPAEKPTNTTAPAATTTTAFGGFGTGTSAFGATPAEGEQKKSAFAFGGAPAGPSPFGATNTPSAFGGGAFGSKPAEEAAKATPPPTTTPASTPASGAPAFSFGFGGNNTQTASTTPVGTPDASNNPFASKPSAFGGPSLFGKPAAEATTTPQGSPFGGSAFKPSAFGAAASPSPFGAAKPDAAATASPFGAPPATSTSIFGNAAAQGPTIAASPPPPYAYESEHDADHKSPFPTYLGSPLPATLQRLHSQPGSPADDRDWLNEKSREELAELLLKAGDLIKERETELDVTSAVCKSLHESNVTLKTKHDALVSRIPPTPLPSPPISNASLDDSPGSNNNNKASPDSSFDSDTDTSPRVYLKRHSRRISVSPADISLLSDQNAELLLKLETLEAEAQSADRNGRRALKQLEKEILLLREELEKTQAQSEQLQQKTAAQVEPEKIVEEMWRKKKEREAKFRAMRNQNSSPVKDDILDFAPPGWFSKASLTPSSSTEEFTASPSYQQFSAEIAADASYGQEPAFEHPSQHALVSQLLSKIQELEETNARIIQQQSETTDKLHAVQRETESISKVYEYFSAENGMEWEVVGEDGFKSPMEGTIRFKSFRRTLESQGDDAFSSLALPRSKGRKSVLDIFSPSENEAGPSTLTIPSSRNNSTLSFTTELSPLRFDTSHSPFTGPTLQSELGDDFNNDMDNPFSRRGSLYDLSFSLSPSPLPGGRPLPENESSTPNALQLMVEPPTPLPGDDTDSGSLRSKSSARFQRMSQTLSRRTSRWMIERFPNLEVPDHDEHVLDESTPKRHSISLPERLSSALDVVMENFTGAVRGESQSSSEDVSPAPPSPVSSTAEEEIMDKSVVVDEPGSKRVMWSGVILEVWLWLQFAVIIVVFLFAMAKQGPRRVIGEAEKRALVSRR
ncbi:hypothetical protein FB45DRAFT_1055407 [Roridomyces roridus]|uniref:Uncharacterized protein n=1 Tax=Roridomyces roridus TaxID=1738132 RepID=A0AAD7FRY1_9AGAR|nr:hypothetical protein FB45DRAFT_1055407 [Roridomyces roridus]